MPIVPLQSNPVDCRRNGVYCGAGGRYVGVSADSRNSSGTREQLVNDSLSAARLIADARRSRAPLQSLPDDIAPRDEADGYKIQAAVHRLLSPDFGPLAGHKIGCTSAVMQQYLGI